LPGGFDDYDEEADEEADDDDGFGDDFDDFEEGEEDAEFGDFDDGFQEAEPVVSQPPSQPQSMQNVPLFVSSKSINTYSIPHHHSDDHHVLIFVLSPAHLGLRQSHLSLRGAHRNGTLHDRSLSSRNNRHIASSNSIPISKPHFPNRPLRLSLEPTRRTTTSSTTRLDPISHPTGIPRVTRRPRRS